MMEDNIKTEALRIAYEAVKASSPYGFTAGDIGFYAAKIINSLNEGLKK